MAWVTKDSTETYDQTPEPPREYTKQENLEEVSNYENRYIERRKC